ncbi:acylphosphatase [Candidatus Nitronereus thalassa]|uniref:Acylphosphatase n=1 Tax=Candidatus Nitronereus thalassa TaxID=3020898 RepID=A0ABU3K4Z6_9BACT|nr:acylphosphatase [Candidatus Nitronereus thalassa]MDT7041479.1 acylphosphatase [Candidatus Nitronereus thalassa]
MVRVHVFVQGHVQGVGFRAFTARQAKSHQVNGWVRNVQDGRVELEAQGLRESVEKFLVDLEQGPALSNVREVSVEWIEPQDQESTFEVKY